MSSPDTPRVIAPPPLIYAGCLGLGLALDGMAGFPGLSLPWFLRDLLGVALLAGGWVLFGKARGLFRVAGTRIEPWKPTTALVTEGVYRRSRNPIYISMALALAGLALLCDSIFALFAVVPCLVVVHHGVILREEPYLLARFGEPYRRYLREVRRWL